ncbi:MAG: hypothetical protein JO023_02455 [Chloroflexi bacterium]|nr:hypothetical protein [Chloroflexota bacterium]
MAADLVPAELLALYDHDERFAATFPDTRGEELPDLVRHLDLVGNSGSVIYSRLEATSADAAIEQQMVYFEGLRLEFEWEAYAHDEPADLVQRLADHGFELDEPRESWCWTCVDRLTRSRQRHAGTGAGDHQRRHQPRAPGAPDCS